MTIEELERLVSDARKAYFISYKELLVMVARPFQKQVCPVTGRCRTEIVEEKERQVEQLKERCELLVNTLDVAKERGMAAAMMYKLAN